jgi:uncharacterized protein YcbK (DUF882 family)
LHLSYRGLPIGAAFAFNAAPMDRRLFLALATGWLATPWQARAVPSAPALRRLSLINAHTGESFDGPYRDALGPIALAMDELSHFLRDHHSGERIAIDVGVIDFLAAVMDAVGATRATVLSAYRTPETNAMLAHTTFGVADNSQHLYGRALDVRLDARLEEAMQAARAMQRGGVGWYPYSGFFHIDSGSVRNWTLDGRGLDGLLLRLHEFLARRGLTVAQQGELLAGRARRPLSVRGRLALHRALAKAELLARRH